MTITFNEQSDIWLKAVDHWKSLTGIDFDVKHFSDMSTDDMKKESQNDLEKFEKCRNGEPSKLANVRKAFVKHIGDTQNILKIFQTAADIAAIFPLAMPAGILFHAAGHVLQAFGDVHADYDDIVTFYNRLSDFIDQLSVIEGKCPNHRPFEQAVACFFACQLEVFCIVQHEYIKKRDQKLRRTTHWLKALWNGKDPKLQKACKDMESAVERIVALLNVETFGATQDIRAAQINFGENQKRDQERFEQKMENLICRQLREFTKKLSSEATKTQAQKGGKADAKDKAFLARNSIGRTFDGSTRFSDWRKALARQNAEKNARTSDFVEDTYSAMFSQPRFETWVGRDTQFLWIAAEEGMGKSFMAHATINHLEKRLSTVEKSSITWFFFKEDSGKVQSVDNSLACIVWRIAESNAKYCQRVGQELTRSSNLDNDMSAWDRLIAKNYPSSGDERLFLVLDGLDEAPAEQAVALFRMLSQIPKERLNIKVFLTSRPTFTPLCDSVSCIRIDVTRLLIATDIKRLISARCESLPRLSKFSKKTKRRIIRAIAAKADGMLYVEHMLKRFSYIGQQDAVLRDLQDIPENLQCLYHRMTTECDKHRSKKQHAALKQLFAWITYSKRPLRLAEAGEIVERTARGAAFDIEDEIRGRSGRLLELRPNFDDNEYDDDMNDETDDAFDDLDIDLLEDNSHILTFQERSLRKFFRSASANDNSGLRTPSSIAHLNIFLLATSAIIDAIKPDTNHSLLSYAAQFWSQHFLEMDIEQLSDNELHMVLVNFHRILTNTGDVASIFEKYANPKQMYLGPLTDDGKSWFDKFQQVIARSASLAKGTLDTVLEQWVREHRSSIENCLTSLAKGHINNWHRSLKARDILQAFSFTVKAINIPIPEMVDDIEKVVSRVSNTFQDIAKDSGEPRAMATVLWLVKNQKGHQRAIELFQHSLAKIQEAECSERFYTLRLLAYCYEAAEQATEAIKSVDKAVASLPKGWESDKDLVMDKCELLAFKAQLLHSKHKVSEAIDTYQACRQMSSIWPEVCLDGWSLDDMLDLIWNRPITSPGFMEMVRKLTDEERRLWFEVLVEYEDTPSLDHLREAVQKEGSGGFEWLNECYRCYEKSLPPGSPQRLIIQAQKAEAYRDIAGDLERAKELFKTALRQPVRPKDESKVESIRSRSRRALAELIFNEFRLSNAPEQKNALLEEMNKMDGSGELSFEPNESQTDVMLALMLRTLGPAVEYEKYMNKTFKVCLQGLRDDVGWNDQASFRLLAKVLACVEGLEREALIALSCQYSMISSDTCGIGKHLITSGSVPAETSVVPGVELQDTPEPYAEEEPLKGTLEASPEEGQKKVVDESSEVPRDEDEDLFSSSLDIFCDGNCGFMQSKWEKPLYYCIICSDCDLCPDCYDDRMAQNHGKEKRNHWRSFCGKDHRYIKAPIAGWRGVKNGYIRITGEEDIRVVDWVKELEEIRWKEAWMSFWRRQDEVRDIGLDTRHPQPAANA